MIGSGVGIKNTRKRGLEGKTGPKRCRFGPKKSKKKIRVSQPQPSATQRRLKKRRRRRRAYLAGGELGKCLARLRVACLHARRQRVASHHPKPRRAFHNYGFNYKIFLIL